VESAAHAAVAAASCHRRDGGSLDPAMPMKPSLFEPAGEAPQAELPMPANFIPPAPERTARPPRMPRIDELPLPAQNEMRAQRGELAEDDHPEKRRMSLMQRLASVGLGRKPEEPEAPPAPRTARPMPQFDRPPQRPPARQPEGSILKQDLPIRCPTMPAVPPRRVSTRTAGRRLCIIRRGRPTRYPGLPAPAGQLTGRNAKRCLAPDRSGAAGFPVCRLLLVK